MSSKPVSDVPRSRFSRFGWKTQVFGLVAVIALWLGTGGRALAEGVVGALRGPSQSSLMGLRDPDQFLAELTPVMPRPVVLLSREDAVAQELLARSRTLTETQALRTAQALCDEARRLGYDPLLFLAVIHIESFYNHLAISPVGAEGLMQLMPPTAAFMAERGKMPWPDQHSFDPVLNVRLGVRYLVELHREFNRMDYALTAYNRGPHNTHFIVRNYGDLPTHVRDFYATKVLDRYEALKALYGHLPLI